jgi:hypothetical protein
VRKAEISQIVPAPPGWYAYGKGANGREFLSPIVCWALVESSSDVRYVVGMCGHGRESVEVAQDASGFIEYRYMPEGEDTTGGGDVAISTQPANLTYRACAT